MSGSGFEIAGIVLSAFPLAINALEICRDTADRVGLFLQIKLEYKRWRDDLEFHKLVFTKNLRQLLLPLVLDDDKIRELLLAPGGDCWREQSVAELFEKRLEESYELYMQYIRGIKSTMDEINRELAIDSKWAQKLLDGSQQTSNNKVRLAEFFARQFHKFKLSNNGAVRKRLFEELQEYNDKLEKLLKANDEDVRLVKHRRSKHQSDNIDVAICGFWKKAKNVFQALASAWICECQQHGAKLLLQHRTTGKIEFEILLTGFRSSGYEIRKVRISEGDDMVAAGLKESITLLENIPHFQPNHKQSYPIKSALRTKNNTKAYAELQRAPPSVTLTCVQTGPHLGITQEISNLCASLEPPEASCYGYLTDEDCRYYVYNISRQNAEAVRSATLDQMLRGEVLPPLTRSQRYTLSLILASTFLQLLDSPWLSAFTKRADIIFLGDENEDATFFRLGQPHISRDFISPGRRDAAASPEDSSNFTEALDHLGIMLLELCFGQIMEDQLWRKRLPVGENETEKTGYDILAAREWQCHVNEEAGGDYAEAVSWCLGGNRSAPRERWRQEMLRRVIQPLHRCRYYLSNGGTAI